MRCRAAQRRFADLLSDAGARDARSGESAASARDARAQARTRAHLGACAACRDAFAALQAAERSLARFQALEASAPPAAPPPDLARRIMARVQRVEDEAARAGFSLAVISLRWPVAAPLACGVLLAAFGFALWQNAPLSNTGTLFARSGEGVDASRGQIADATREQAQLADASRERAATQRAPNTFAQTRSAQTARGERQLVQSTRAQGWRAQPLAAHQPERVAHTGDAAHVARTGDVTRAGDIERVARASDAARAGDGVRVARVNGADARDVAQPGVALEQLSGAQLAALAETLATQRLGSNAFATPEFFAQRSARTRRGNFEAPAATRAPSQVVWSQRGRAQGNAREAVAAAPRAATTRRVPTHRDHCALALDTPACGTWKAIMLGLAERNADAFAAEADAVPAASRTRWLQELARSAEQHGLREDIAAHLRASENPRAQEFATHFE